MIMHMLVVALLVHYGDTMIAFLAMLIWSRMRMTTVMIEFTHVDV